MTIEASTADQSTADRALIVAAQLFRTKGYSASTTREIAAHLGINKATLYHHFGGKEDLLHDLSAESLKRMKTDVAIAIASETDPLSRLRTCIRVHVTTMLADRDKHASMLFELRSLTGERAAHVLELRDQYEQIIRAVLQEGQERGPIRDDVAVKYLALGLLNMLNWTIFWFEPDGDLAPDQLAEVLAELFLFGAVERGNSSDQ
jgi:TetR/AcrR family transcriptional regulator, cholesterol catabolism regulator